MIRMLNLGLLVVFTLSLVAVSPRAADCPCPPTTPPPATSWWQPSEAGEWQLMINGAFDVNNATHMGTGITAYNGARPPATDPTVYEIDGWINPASTVAALKNTGRRTVCYISVGTAENYRPDYAALRPYQGNAYSGNEWFLDIRPLAVLDVMRKRIEMCQAKGFDAVKPDMANSYTENTGFPLTKTDAVSYFKALATHAHSVGIAFFGQNPDTGDDYAQLIAPYADGVHTEQCHQFSGCPTVARAFAGKAVFNSERRATSRATYCADGNSRPGWNTTFWPSTEINDGKGRAPCK